MVKEGFRRIDNRTFKTIGMRKDHMGRGENCVVVVWNIYGHNAETM